MKKSFFYSRRIYLIFSFLLLYLYMSLIILLLSDGQFKKNIYRKIAFLISIWALSILSLIPFGWNRVLLSYFTLLFFIAFYNFIYIKLRYMLSPLLPKKKEDGSKLFPPPGSNLKLEDYGVTERQKLFALECVLENMSYSKISEKNYVSISTVKAEMASLFKCLGVKNKEDLRFFLLQYNLV